ncbi:protein-disulfide reductase DsbD [Zooshikella marina]|uniref:protein-disulfide reductase DsbD n=1 Tax=Zooshikella ganghwensis TaxID=202772 RepID=UPI001BAE5B79|nr:protein-disulfide reductase DsbD [Zooshikella ganghwensis]MBU2706171.1 protein-disulfide reductase DsbD [Zooshikella ganghwensis]
MKKSPSLLQLASLLLLLGLLSPLTYSEGLFDRSPFNNNALSSIEDSEFLPVEEAFQVQGYIEDGTAYLTFKVTPEHYLYKGRFRFRIEDAGITSSNPVIPSGKIKFDPFQQKDVEVFEHDVTVKLPLNQQTDLLSLAATFQGCAEKGLCYPPHTINLALTPQRPAGSTPTTTSSQPLNTATTSTQAVSSKTVIPATTSPISSNTTLEATYTELLSSGNWLWIILMFVIAGLGLSFTPCVFPMMPILSSIIVGEHQRGQLSQRQSITLSLCFVLGMAITYTIVGSLMGLLGADYNLQAQFQSPWLLIPFAILFVLLAFAMFGFYELQLPQFLRDRIDRVMSKQQGGSYLSAGVMGIFSSLLVSPCVSAPLIGILLFISQTGDATLGAVSLFSLSIGMGIPLLLIGAGGAKLLPKAGNWMNAVKSVFGVLLLGVAIWLLERLIPGPLTLMLWAALLICSAIYLGALNFTPKTQWRAFFQGLGIILLIYGSTLIIGAAQGNHDPLRPLATASGPIRSQRADFTTVTTTQQLTSVIAQASVQKKPVLVDIYADWCISCKVIERDVLTKPEVNTLLSQFMLVKADITDNTPDHSSLLKEYGLFGPPALLFFDQQGNELSSLRLQGDITAQSLKDRLTSVLN